jgi:hypothetical protein
MYLLQTVGIDCPYCAEPIDIVVDASVEQQQYIEDCQVCCRPIQLSVSVSESGDIQVQALDEDTC